MQPSDRTPRDPGPAGWNIPVLGATAAVVLVVALLVRDPWVGAVAVVAGVAAGWGALRYRDEAAWSDRGWRQLEQLSPELVGQLDERAILRVALADSPALLRAEMTQVLLHPIPGAEAVAATQRALGSDDVEIRDLRPDDAAVAAGADLAVGLPGPGGEIGTLVVRGGDPRHRRTRRRLGQGLAHLVASSVAAARIHEQQRTLVDDLYRSALRDDITALGNRTLLHERGRQQLARSMAQGKSAALLLIDLDDFKRVNDTLGHRVGDQLLAEVGDRIRHQVRGTDLAVRLGGDEFVVLAGELAAPEDAELLADRLLAAIAEPMLLDGIELQLSGSLGIAVHGEDADSLDGLVVVADQAMYQAKAAGRARWRRRSRPSAATHGLLDPGCGVPERELELHYQPQVAVVDGGVVGFEVIPRWRHPELGLLGPEEFLPELERRGLSSQLTAGVLGRALEDLPRLREWAPGATLSVNVSARDLLRLDLVSTVGAVLAGHGATGSDLVLEMMEPAPALSATLDSVLTGLGDLGCLVSIHEFGTGQSSLAAMSSHPTIAEVKVAPRLVSTVLTDERALRLVRVAVDCAHSLGLRVVAEGVDTVEVATALTELGCDRLQGSQVGEAGAARAVVASPRPALSPAR